jgi:hypothetical protein
MRGDSLLPMIKEGHMAAPCLTEHIDYSVFKQTPTERGAAYTAKAGHKRDLRQAYGDKWKKNLNVPEKKLGEVLRMSF